MATIAQLQNNLNAAKVELQSYDGRNNYALRQKVLDAQVALNAALAVVAPTPNKFDEAAALIIAIPHNDYGRDYFGLEAKAAAQKFAALGGQARLDVLLRDPAVAAEMARRFPDKSSSFFGGLFEGVKTFATEAGVKETLLLAGVAFGVSALAGTEITAATAANVSGATAQTAGQTFAQALATSQAETAALLSTAPATVPGALSLDAAITAGLGGSEAITALAVNAGGIGAELNAILAAPVSDAALFGLSPAPVMSSAQSAALSVADVVQSAPLPKPPTSTPAPSMPVPQAALPSTVPTLTDKVIDTALGVGTSVGTAALVGTLAPEKPKVPAPVVQTNEGLNIPAILATLAAVGGIVFLT